MYNIFTAALIEGWNHKDFRIGDMFRTWNKGVQKPTSGPLTSLNDYHCTTCGFFGKAYRCEGCTVWHCGKCGSADITAKPKPIVVINTPLNYSKKRLENLRKPLVETLGQDYHIILVETDAKPAFSFETFYIPDFEETTMQALAKKLTTDARTNNL